MMKNKVNIKSFAIEFLATFCWSGYLPLFPGTWASFFSLFVAYYFLQGDYFLTYVYLIYFFLILGVWSAAKYDQTRGSKDNSCIVIDEFVGQLITLLPLFFYGNDNLWFYLFGFVLFRFFDISKVMGIRKIQDLPGGFGVMADDILAGLYGAIILQGALWLIK